MASKSTDPSKVVVTVNSKFGTDNLVSRFTIEYSDEDASFVINYYVESFNPDFMADEYKIVSEGTITCDAEGNYSDGGSFVGSNPAATGVKADLNKLKNYVTSETTLTATVAKADTASVFGTAYGSDVTLVVTKNSSSIVSVSLAYADVQILCVYN
jgi:hypothetical protein